MKAILLSIKTKWAEKFYSGEKIIEVRKSRPEKALYRVYFRESGTGMITGEGFLVGVADGNPPPAILTMACLTREQLEEYAGGMKVYFWCITNARRYAKPFDVSCVRGPQSWCYTEDFNFREMYQEELEAESNTALQRRNMTVERRRKNERD